jgi:hypothetical protein
MVVVLWLSMYLMWKGQNIASWWCNRNGGTHEMCTKNSLGTSHIVLYINNLASTREAGLDFVQFVVATRVVLSLSRVRPTPRALHRAAHRCAWCRALFWQLELLHCVCLLHSLMDGTHCFFNGYIKSLILLAFFTIFCLLLLYYMIPECNSWSNGLVFMVLRACCASTVHSITSCMELIASSMGLSSHWYFSRLFYYILSYRVLFCRSPFTGITIDLHRFFYYICSSY